MNDPLEHIPNGAKHVADALSVATVIGTLAQWLPSLAALFTILWTAIRIWETETVRGWTGREKKGG